MKILISACLLNEPVRYDGQGNAPQDQAVWQRIQQWQQQGLLVPVCPELLGGLPVPRPPAEIIASSNDDVDGHDVLAGSAQVMTDSGKDVSTEFINGAKQTLRIAQQHQTQVALLAARSPSCGSGLIYNGEFSGDLITGSGVTVALLEQQGIRCFSPEQLSELQCHLQQA